MNTDIKSVHVLRVTYSPQTNHNPAKIKVISLNENHNDSVVFSWNSDFGKDTCEIAEYWLKENGFNVLYHAIGKDCYYIISDTFEPLKKPKMPAK